MKELTCIVCPNGCTLFADETGDGIRVTGNQCRRGEEFAIAELTHPMRTIASTVRTVFSEMPVVPVRVSGEIPKERIFDVMRKINEVVLDTRMSRGDVVIPDVLGLGVDVILTGEMSKVTR